ncbi:MAG TPA: hypothetical protein VLE43_19990 [Candidatus Saccharimonadia bacterium]|nr:hypothetical protein [Candidatus Saccharimonadia bacterium]
MATLTNSYQNCELLNLRYGSGGRGPFIVRQDGTPPGSVTFQQERFLLRKDGTWVISLAVYPLSEKEKEQFLFESSAEAMQLLEELRGEPLVEAGLPKGISVEQLKAAAQSTITGIWARMQNAKREN